MRHTWKTTTQKWDTKRFCKKMCLIFNDQIVVQHCTWTIDNETQSVRNETNNLQCGKKLDKFATQPTKYTQG